MVMKKGFDKNIVFIGMPGSGKSTIGSIVAEMLDMPFIDIDDYIEEREEKSINQIFKQGEEHFRDIETSAIKEVCKRSYPNAVVISTGGGAVKRPENMEALKENSIIIFLNRSVNNIIGDIDIQKRPLLAEGEERLYKLYEERYPLYNMYSDIKIDNDFCIGDAIDEIMSILK